MDSIGNPSLPGRPAGVSRRAVGIRRTRPLPAWTMPSTTSPTDSGSGGAASTNTSGTSSCPSPSSRPPLGAGTMCTGEGVSTTVVLAISSTGVEWGRRSGMYGTHPRAHCGPPPGAGCPSAATVRPRSLPLHFPPPLLPLPPRAWVPAIPDLFAAFPASHRAGSQPVASAAFPFVGSGGIDAPCGPPSAMAARSGSGLAVPAPTVTSASSSRPSAASRTTSLITPPGELCSLGSPPGRMLPSGRVGLSTDAGGQTALVLRRAPSRSSYWDLHQGHKPTAT